MKTLLERFESKFIPEPNSGCWIWTGCLTPKGYGHFYYRPKIFIAAHIAAWELYKGSREGLCVLHQCDMPCCVNPEHLWLGTQIDNIKDRHNKGRTARGERSNRLTTRFTEADIIAIRNDPAGTSAIARRFGVSRGAIQNIRERKNWKHIP